eukprot:3680788-Amphidinium_carterae.1
MHCQQQCHIHARDGAALEQSLHGNSWRPIVAVDKDVLLVVDVVVSVLDVELVDSVFDVDVVVVEVNENFVDPTPWHLWKSQQCSTSKNLCESL